MMLSEKPVFYLSPESGIQHMNGYTLVQGKRITVENIQGALQLDYMLYDDIYHLEWEKCVEYHRKNPYIYIMALDNSGKVAGYINFSPIRDSVYETMRNGESVDTFISPDDIEEYRSGGSYSIYFSSICVHPEHQNKGIARMMLKRLTEFESLLAEAGITIRRIVADAVSDSGEKILKNNGFALVLDSQHGSRIMEKKLKEVR